MAKEVLCVTASGLLQLGTVTPFGIQTSIENFASFSEAKSWAKRNGISLRYYSDGQAIREEDLSFLASIQNSSSITEAVAASGRSSSGIVGTLLRLSSLGYLHLSRSKRWKDWKIALTDLAKSTLSSLAGAMAHA
ncbi:hypothetical protein HKD27_05905 [Gluconobacter sp. R75690]|uniref:hypothetical protein n=1 Tax=unclassified Gluconobacter TaxID=2644261 RepID=UPI00188CC930|nr:MULTISPECIES: hypothetical protein [unclassified Gluconobacter]MBF0850459.1 hypothetical protein [Gluconobacter sp. R75690]MBF0879151.1 hypothetical protein [Gluconobacter sp. R75828]